jgi:hypothetical protein
MSRYRLVPTAAQEAVLKDHCAHARFVWNLAVEQQCWWRAGRGGTPGYLEQCRQLTEARAEFGWLRDGSQMVQQQALRDFSQAMASFFAGAHGRPSWHKARRDEGFRIVGIKPEQRFSAQSPDRQGVDTYPCREPARCEYDALGQRDGREARHEGPSESRAQP